MIKKILSLLFSVTAFTVAMAQGGSGQGYDPTNPPDPQANYRLTVKSSPEYAGYVSYGGSQMIQVGEQLYMSASPNPGYKFEAWRIGEEIVSEYSDFYFTMPAQNVVLTAWFDYVGLTPGNPDYNPENPGDPFKEGYQHNVKVYCTPSSGGWVHNSNFYMTEGEEATLYAYHDSSFKFSCWKQDGNIISLNPELHIRMGDKDLSYTAQFVYNPQNPGDPLPNSWNNATGELIMDHFEPGNLWGAIGDMIGWDGFDRINTLIVIGEITPGDFGVVGSMSGITEADFSRTSGAHYVPWGAFSWRESLTKVMLPSSITSLENYAFDNCQNLSELSVYAVMPPDVENQSFNSIPRNLVVKVYSGSVDLYENAKGWKNFTIRTLDEDTSTFTVYLPDDYTDGRYKNAVIHLSNLSSGQTSRLIVTGNRNKYIFSNLIPDMKYSLYVLSPSGHVMGSYPEFEMTKEGAEYKFPKLLSLQEVHLRLLSPEGDDITDKAQISWYDSSDILLGTGSTLTGQVEGDKVKYEIHPSQELGIEYIRPNNGNWTVKSFGNTLEIHLKKLRKETLTGTVTDSKNREPVKNGFVTVTQIVNDVYSVANSAQINDKGEYSVDIYDYPGIITAGASDYIEKNIEFTDLENAYKVADITLEPISGYDIMLSLNSQNNIVKGSAIKTALPYENYANMNFEVKNLTSGNEVYYSYRYPKLILIDGFKKGDKIEIRAIPGNESFKPATETINVSGETAELEFVFVTDGDLSARYADTEATEVIGLLFDNKGHLYDKQEFENSSALFTYVPSGSYTFVAMSGSKVFSGVGSMAELENSALSKGKDYLAEKVVIEEGYVTELNLGNVPVFDETLFYYTGEETSVSVNKKSVTVGATVTVRSKVDFLPEYSDRIEKVNIIFTIPEGCDYVENSLMVAGDGANFTTYSEGLLSVEVNVKDASPRFCIIPRKGGDYRPSAVIEFELDGKKIRQPIGSALFKADDFSISVPARSSVPEISARGTATPLSEIKVYDNEVLVGSTRSLNNGEWKLKFRMFNPGENGTEHYIYAVITTPEGIQYKTETGKTLYDIWMADLTDIHMIYNSSLIDFNYVEAETLPVSYSYVPGTDMFTFKALFRDGHGERISDLDFIILLSDGSRRRIAGKYLIGTETWTCALGFPDVNRLPVNVKVLYREKKDTEVSELVDDIDAPFRCPDVIPVIDPSGYVYEAVYSNRIAGVTSTIYYREWVEDMYGDVTEKAVKWDAEAYAQENPLFTDEDGMYQWDVPSGDWQVRFEKEGYESAQTEWLPVPPPQLDINVPLSRMTNPEVKYAYAYPSGIQIEFDKYMDPLTLIGKNIKVTVNGGEIAGTIELLNKEEGENGKSFASVVYFKAATPIETEEVTLMVSKVKSYAGIQMEEPYYQEFTVETPIDKINSPAVTKAYVGYDKNITVRVEPFEAAAGKQLYVDLSTPILEVPNVVTLDEDAKAVITLRGNLPGKAYLKFNVEDIYVVEDFTTEVNVDIISAEIPETSITSGTPVYRNGNVEIFTDSRIGEIYYTIDGTIPTETSGILYVEPITITDETNIKAINVINDVVYSVSDVAEFTFPLKRAQIAHDLEKGWNWMSHNLESNVKVEDITPADKIEQILSLTKEIINDPVYGMVGTLKELSPDEGYKVKVTDKVTLNGTEDIALHPATPFTVYRGWNWIGYHGDMEMELNHVLSPTKAEYGDIIEGKDGFAIYDGETWIGDLTSLKPSHGYLFFSQSVKNVVHNHLPPKASASKVESTGNGQTESSFTVDKSKYPSIMPVIAELRYSDGSLVNHSDWEVAAFCGSECRGIGKFTNGYLFISVYGNLSDEIYFFIRNHDGETKTIQPSVRFTEKSLGSLDDPYVIDATRGTGNVSTLIVNEEIKVTAGKGKIQISGSNLLSVIVADINGISHYINNNINEECIIVDSLVPGIYFVNVIDNGKDYQYKVFVK